MRQVVQHIRTGETTAQEIPAPVAGPHEVLVDVRASLISAGTERYVVELANKSLLEKARARPDHVRRVLQKLRQEGVIATARQVKAKLDEPMALGYSAAGEVLETGRAVQKFKPGDRVAVAGPHAGIVAAGENLCAVIPAGVSYDQAAFAGVASIALQGLRLANVELGGRVLVIGLGLIGQLTVGLLKAQGCRVFGVDLDERRLELARSLGADAVAMGSPRDAIMAMTEGQGIDASIITAATESNGPLELSADVCRPKGRIVMVGVAGMDVPRPLFFRKELELVVSNSLGAGRTDRQYEEKGQDYPIGYARWTVQRNMRAVLETIETGALNVDRLTTHRFDVGRASEAYDLLADSTDLLGVLIQYPSSQPKPDMPLRRRVDLPRKRKDRGDLGVSIIGAGNFTRLVMLPALSTMSGLRFRGLCSGRGLNAVVAGRDRGFSFAATDYDEVLADDETDAVFVTTRHDSHAQLVLAALKARKHVFVEKPLCLRLGELEEIASTLSNLGPDAPVLAVGFNRRFAPSLDRVRGHFAGVEPLTVNYRFGAGELPPDTWPQDDEVGGGRIIGEAVHAIDACAAIAASPPVRVYAESAGMTGGIQTTDDRVVITMRHENGALSSVSYQAGNDRGAPKERIEVFGGGRTAFLEDFGTVELWQGGARQRHRALPDKGHEKGLKSFVAACRTGRPPIPYPHLIGATWASIAAVRSLRDGMPVTLAPLPEDAT